MNPPDSPFPTIVVLQFSRVTFTAVPLSEGTSFITAVAVSVSSVDTVPLNVPVSCPIDTVPETSRFDWVRDNVIGSTVPAVMSEQKSTNIGSAEHAVTADVPRYWPLKSAAAVPMLPGSVGEVLPLHAVQTAMTIASASRVG